jgi:uncharacterized protein (TIGR02391 family)
MTPQSLEKLVQKIHELQTLMVAVGTGEARIQEKDDEYKKLYMEVSLELESLQSKGFSVDNPNSFRSLWDWYSYWSANLGSYALRRQHVRELYEKVLTPFENTLYKHNSNSISSEELIDDLQHRLGQTMPETQTSIEEVLEAINDFVLDLDSEYYSDFEQIVFEKTNALRSHLKALGFSDLVSDIDESRPVEGNVINVLEVLRGYIIPETRRRLQEKQTNSTSEPFWAHLHPRIRSIAKSRYDAGHYADSVQAALKEVNNIVKAHYRQLTASEIDGANLMNMAFSPKNPKILLADISTETGQNIQQGYMQIFAGSMIGIRNPTAHENLQTEQIQAIHQLYLASLLLYVFDERLEP